MKALWIEGPGLVRFGNLPEPELQPGWVRLKVLAASVCGSDLNTYRFGRSYYVERRVSGHEFIGRIEEVWDSSSSWKVVGLSMRAAFSFAVAVAVIFCLRA